MGLKLRKHERGFDFVIRKGSNGFHLYSISERAKDILVERFRTSLHVNGGVCVTLSQKALQEELTKIQLPITVVGFPTENADVATTETA